MKPKILFISNVDWFFVSHRLPIALKAISNGYEVHIATKLTGKHRELENNGIVVHSLEIDRTTMSTLDSINTFIQIIFLIYKIKPNIVHSITIKPVILGGIACRIYGRCQFVASVSGLGYVFIAKGYIAKLTRILITFLYKIALSSDNVKVIFQNKNDLQIVSRICKLTSNNIILINGSGIDLSIYKYKKNLINSNTILFASRLLISKGLMEFVATARDFQDANCKFVIAGKIDIENPDCVSEEEMRSWASIPSVEYVGQIEDVKELIYQSKIVVLPSYYGEGLPKILIEAAACGRPIITTDHPGCRDAIIPEKTGLLIPVRDSFALSNAIKKLLDSPELCYQMGKAGRELAIRRYDINIVIQQHMKIYEEIIKS